MRYKKNVGDNGEEFAIKLLEEKGFNMIDKNYFTKFGEIDIICAKDGVLHFIEVKTRTTEEYGFPSDAITEAKKERMKKSAECYLSKRRPFWKNYSIDVLEIMTNLIVDCVQ